MQIKIKEEYGAEECTFFLPVNLKKITRFWKNFRKGTFEKKILSYWSIAWEQRECSVGLGVSPALILFFRNVKSNFSGTFIDKNEMQVQFPVPSAGYRFKI